MRCAMKIVGLLTGVIISAAAGLSAPANAAVLLVTEGGLPGGSAGQISALQGAPGSFTFNFNSGSTPPFNPTGQAQFETGSLSGQYAAPFGDTIRSSRCTRQLPWAVLGFDRQLQLDYDHRLCWQHICC